MMQVCAEGTVKVLLPVREAYLGDPDNRVFEFTKDGRIVTQQPNAAALDTIVKRY